MSVDTSSGQMLETLCEAIPKVATGIRSFTTSSNAVRKVVTGDNVKSLIDVIQQWKVQ